MIHLDYIRDGLNDYVARNYADKDIRPTVHVFPESDGPPTGKAVNIRITAATMPDALHASDTVMDFMKTVAELSALTDLADDRPYTQKIVRYFPRHEAVSEYGLRPGEVTGLVAGALSGHYVGGFRTSDEEVDLKVRLARRDDKVNMRNTGLSEPMDILDVP
jgi:HAE1 family hydrophobic/amphiphilic exporter-1